MKVLVATHLSQGQRKNDFCWVDEGELVMSSFECDGESVDGKCGCKRSLVGIVSHRATTTFKVIEDPTMTREILSARFAESLKEAGWIQDGEERNADNVEWVNSLTDEMVEVANFFATGAIVERRGNRYHRRRSN